MLTVMNTIINSVMNTVMSMCSVTNSVLKPVMNRESHLLTTSGLVMYVAWQLLPTLLLSISSWGGNICGRFVLLIVLWMLSV